jgi:hypothetical protein
MLTIPQITLSVKRWWGTFGLGDYTNGSDPEQNLVYGTAKSETRQSR